MINLDLQIEFVSYGHWKLTTTRYNKKVSIITTDSELVDRVKRGLKTAKSQAIRKVRLHHFLNQKLWQQ